MVIKHFVSASNLEGNRYTTQGSATFRFQVAPSIPCNAMQLFRKPKRCLFHHLFRFRITLKHNSPYPFPILQRPLNLHLHTTRASPDSDSKDPTTTTPPQSHNPIDAGSSNRKPISLWPGMHHSPATHALWEARSTIFENPVHEDPSSQTQPVPKSPSRSRTSILYNFSSDLVLREQYRNPWNHIRMGKLVEDFDALAGTIAFKVFFFSKLNSGFCLFQV